MPLGALKAVAKSQNGVGAFIKQCKRLDFHYCDWAGSSKGMVAFLKHKLPDFAKANPHIEITVSPRPNKHPVIKGHYVNKQTRAICVKKLEPGQILKKAELLRDSNGTINKRQTNKPVRSMNENVRGIWSPFHGARYQI
ncbi:thioredoxin-like protein [Phyllosticta capitalensis]|uniref:Large ribosomal subunit protein mL43 n=1 Tax=Phyllosticta capitalensis TaxID=121624 RepID=A0ABR1YJL1_9PEZI